MYGFRQSGREAGGDNMRTGKTIDIDKGKGTWYPEARQWQGRGAERDRFKSYLRAGIHRAGDELV